MENVLQYQELDLRWTSINIAASTVAATSQRSPAPRRIEEQETARHQQRARQRLVAPAR